jgi:ATP-dependent protease ClpP protease subunit
MQYIKPDVATICTEWQLLWEHCYVQVLKETFCIATSRVMIHQPSGGGVGY